MRQAYLALMDDPSRIETILLAGAEKARARATPLMAQLRHAVGLRPLVDQSKAVPAKMTKLALPSFKQYREADGQFRFKLVDAQGHLLLQSRGYDSPKQAGQAISVLQRDGAAALQSMAAHFQPLDGDMGAVEAALAMLMAGAHK